MSDESASGSDPDLDPDVELEDAEEEEEEEEVAVEEHGGDGEEDLLGGEWPREARSRGLGVPRGLGPGGAGDGAPGRAPGRAPPGGRAHGSPVPRGWGPWAPRPPLHVALALRSASGRRAFSLHLQSAARSRPARGRATIPAFRGRGRRCRCP